MILQVGRLVEKGFNGAKACLEKKAPWDGYIYLVS